MIPFRLPNLVAAVLLALSAAPFAASTVTAQPRPTEAETGADFFERRVRPILVQRCYECHGPDSEHEAGLRVDSRGALLRGGDSGPAIVPGRPQASLLIDAINYGEIYEMPPDSKLPAEEIAVLTDWVRRGAPWPSSGKPARPDSASSRGYQYTDEDRNYWAFVPPAKPELPTVREKHWPRSPIDHFVLARLEAGGLSPAPPADKRTWIRRVTFDLHGLPPTPEEIEAFLQDDSPQAFARVVDRLLASPRYGERWGRHWLDVARYADSNGGDQNRIHAHAWRYRDYVIASINEDKPYDRFITEQLAGDLLPWETRQQRNQLWIATGFLAIGPKPLIKNDDALCEMDVVDEQITTVGSALMGLTLGCARCHDHKFDPFPMTDYYALAGIFKSTRTIDRYVMRTHRSWTERALGSDADEHRHRELKREFDDVNNQRRLFGDDKKKRKFFVKEMDRVRRELAKIPVAMAVREGKAADCRLHRRGNPRTLGDPVPRGFPAILCREPPPAIDTSRSGRLELAYWLTSPDHPLTDRVIVNRIWQWHFGRGLVPTPSNFGRLGTPPTHPRLLDWLAVYFREHGRSLKNLHRLILLSSTYRMSARATKAGLQRDPDNKLLWRFSPRRLEAEEIRDAMLMTAGQLDLHMGGRSLPPIANYELTNQKKTVRRMIDAAYQSNRRSVYLPVIRSGLYDMFRVFDFANPGLSTGSRSTTTVAPQALLMMNSPFTHRAAARCAAQLSIQYSSLSEQLDALYLSAFGRPLDPAERRRLEEFLLRYQADATPVSPDSPQGGASRRLAMEALCRALFCSNEFIYIY